MHAFLLDNRRQLGPALIAAGLTVVLAAHVWSGVPIAAAMMLIGYGATLTILMRGVNQEWLGVCSLAMYSMLSLLAGAAQTHAAENGPMGRVDVLMLADHFLAFVLFVLLTRSVVRRVFQPSPIEP